MAGDQVSKITQWIWTPARSEAAELTADDHLSDEQIATRVHVTRKTLQSWRKRPEFAARVAERREAQRAAIEAKGIADKQNRVKFLNERHAALRQVVKERGEHESMAEVPGGTTGYVVRTFKSIGFGAGQRTIEEHAVDTGLLKEFRAHEQQAAQELGEWVEKVAPTKGDGSDLDLASLLQKARALRESRGEDGDVGATAE
jgi:hypothetical protein